MTETQTQVEIERAELRDELRRTRRKLDAALARVAALEAVADAARVYRREYAVRGPIVEAIVVDWLFTALDALPPAADPRGE